MRILLLLLTINSILHTQAQLPSCGDGVCSSTETISGCPTDCVPKCGDGVCVTATYDTLYPIESASNCPKDCKPYCGDGVCAKVPLPQYQAETLFNCPEDCKSTCGNGVCEAPLENCLTCADCSSCSFNGAVIQYSRCISPIPCKNSISVTSNFEYKPVNGNENFASYSGVLEGYVNTTGIGVYELLLQGTNVGGKLWINGGSVMVHPPTNSLKLLQTVTLPSKYIHFFKLEFSSSKSNHSISLSWRAVQGRQNNFQVIDKVFYSKGICGDGILDPSEDCAMDANATLSLSVNSSTLGTGLCVVSDPNTRFFDCFRQITSQCSPIKVFPNKLFAGLPTSGDTLGSFIDNQMLWRLPGADLLSYGIDFISGERRLSPLFYFSYCNSSTLQVVQDAYRGNTYIVPEELHAQSSPKCSFSMESTKYSSSSEMSQEMSQNSGMSASANAGASFEGFGLKINAAYSKEQSVSQARSLEAKASGSLISTQVSCEASKVKMSKVTFHPAFLEDLANAKTDEDFIGLVKRYGTHYYKRATLGGRLKQITVMSKSTESSQTETDQTQSAQRSFGASVSSPVFSVGGSYSDTTDNSVSASAQTDFENESSRSTVITYGGPPGSFGPSGSTESPTTFGNWAPYIDLLPVPIEYEVGLISDIIPIIWTSVNGTRIVDLWNQGIMNYQIGGTEFEAEQLGLKKYSFIFSWNNGNAPSDWIYSMILVVQNNSQTIFGSMTPGHFGFFGPSSYLPYNITRLSIYLPESILSIDSLQFKYGTAPDQPELVITSEDAWLWLVDEQTGLVYSFNTPIPKNDFSRANDTWYVASKDSFPEAGASYLLFELHCNMPSMCDVFTSADQYLDIVFKGKKGYRPKNFLYKLDSTQLPTNNSLNPVIFKELGFRLNLQYDSVEITLRSLATTYVPPLDVLNVIVVDSQLVNNGTAVERKAYMSTPDVPYTLTISGDYRAKISLKSSY